MPDMVIARVNKLGVNQPKHQFFTDRHGRIIGYVEIPGVGAESEEEEVELLEMELEGNFELPGLYVEVQEAPQVVNIDDPYIPQYAFPIYS